ncbi:hypothetical protein [Geothrix fuzhouensis]|uniref:hypothetical protein n=1 Tax=Geothrix fuzhouensis TaxID=2966451 RepID=UPI002148D954|nr:hypothetical protein [Geothrix fuzhouensis]
MSTWHVRAIERLGTPQPSWPTIWGPAAPGSDPIAANGLRTVDLTPFLSPLQDFSSTLERDLTKASYSSLPIDLVDPDESKATLLGPFSGTMATTDRYYGPWIEVTEVWGTSSVVRWTGYLDETSLQWDEAAATTKATVLHASQLLRERRLADLPGLLRPYPSVPTTATEAFAQSTADALLHAAVPAYTPRTDAVAIEVALWATGRFSWYVDTSALRETTWADVGGHSRPFTAHESYPPPPPPSLSLTIGSTLYHVDHIEWDISADVAGGVAGDYSWVSTQSVARIVLQGAPDLTGILTLGATVTWGIAENQRTHYVLAENVPAPASGSDGQRWMKLTCVEQLVAGDSPTITFWDTTNSVQRRSSLDVTVIDVDGETGKVWLTDPLGQALTTSTVLKIRRNSLDPVLFDGVAFAARAVAPFALDTTYLRPAATSRPVLTWMPHDTASPQLYGVISLQSIDRSGGLRLARRGALRESDNTYPLNGVWEGSWSAGWSWLGMPTGASPLQILGDLNQWPGGTNTARPPVLYVQGDLSAGATIPPNGWRGYFRTWKDPLTQIQDAESWWNGTAVQWVNQAPTGLIPTKLVSFSAQTVSPGRYTRTNAPAWTFEPHTGAGTLGAAVTPTLTGTLPTGNWLTLGMGIYASGDEQEALLGLVVPDSAQPFTAVSAALLSQASGGNLTLRQSVSLWATGSVPAGTWAVGGGLVVQTITETVDGVAYPKTILHKLDGTNHLTATFRTMEVIPQSIQPLSLAGSAGAMTISGWYALGIETYLDGNFAAARRLRFLWLGPSLTLLNGDPEPDPSDPLNLAASFRRGDVVSSLIPDGALPCRLARTGIGDACAGFIGGRLFQVDTTIPRTVEHLKVGEASTTGKDASGLSAANYVELLASALLATAIPAADGNLRMVSRGSGPLQVQDIGAGNRISVQASQRGPRKTTQTYRGYVSEVRVNFTDVLTGDSAQAVVVATHDGGKPITLDMSALVGGITAARAIGEAAAYWFGAPAGVLSETWVDRTGGVAQGLTPPFWATWQIGDLVTFTSHAIGSTTPLEAYKLHQFRPRAENREVGVELIKLPVLINPAAP